MKFLLAADLHLDAKLESNLPPAKARKRKRELLDTFRRILKLGEEKGAGVILLAGDLFDADRVSDRTRDFVSAAIAEHPGLTVLYLRGNHDGGFGGEELPGNVRTFGGAEGWRQYRFGNVVFTGTEDNAAPDIYERLTLAPEDVNVVMMHGQVSPSSSVPAPDSVCLKLLKNKNIDLLALGHLHTARVDKLDRRGRYAYPGCPDGRGFDECGEKGVYLFDVGDDGKLTETFLPTSSRTLHAPEVDVSGLETYPEVEEKVLDAVSGIPGDDLVKVVLTGSRSPDARPVEEHLTETLRSRFFFAKVKDMTTLEIRPEDYVGDISLKGEFIRSVLASRMPEEMKNRVILTGLRALRGEEPDV